VAVLVVVVVARATGAAVARLAAEREGVRAAGPAAPAVAERGRPAGAAAAPEAVVAAGGRSPPRDQPGVSCSPRRARSGLQLSGSGALTSSRPRRGWGMRSRAACR